jgi:phospholipid/cholesterol/gamma-HCH transport system ATP-binding protein
VIRLVDLHKAFGPKRVLRGLSLDVPEGGITVLLGYSGSGKSVALKHIVGLLAPDAGRAEVDGLVVHELDRDELAAVRGRIGYVFQFAALLDSLSVGDNIRLALARRGLDDAEVEARVRASLAAVELPDAAALMPAELSGGMRKRVGIARAISYRPKYLLFDEPTTGLDPVTSAAIDELMARTCRELHAAGLVITHDLRSAFAVGDRIGMLYAGRLRQLGTPDEIRDTADPVVRQFIEGRPGPGEPAAAAEEA